jgi:hypothetical protein
MMTCKKGDFDGTMLGRSKDGKKEEREKRSEEGNA